MHHFLIFLLAYPSMCSETNPPSSNPSEEKNIKINPTYCNADWCDPSHEPYPNIVSIMTGYNILKGNPFTTTQSIDPGFSTGYIFVPVTRTADGTYALESGITVRQTLQCSLTSSSETITTLQNYVKKVQSKSSEGGTFTSNLEFEVKGKVEKGGVSGSVTTKIPPLVQSSFSSSNEYKNNKKFFESTKGVMTLRDATCATYSVVISSYQPPPFSDGFKDALTQLNDATNKDKKEQKRAFRKFVREFGTHFLQQATMGARTAVTRRYTQKEFRNSTDDQIQNCNEQRLLVTIAGVGVGKSSDSCNNIDMSSDIYSINGAERESITSYGSKPAKDLFEWSKQKFESPLPIAMKLSPILNLFTKNYMKRLPNIKYKEILNWFMPFYNRYCINEKRSLGIEECSLADKKKCGINDNCVPRKQACIDIASTNNFQCCDLKCLSKPCKNNGVCEDVIDTQCNFRCDCTNGWSGPTCEASIANFDDLSKDIEQRMLEQKELDNTNFVKYLYNYLKEKYTNYNFIVNAYKEYDDSENSRHAAIGNYVHFYKKHGRNLVVGWANKNSRTPINTAIDKIKSDLLGYVDNYNSNAYKSVYKAWNDYYVAYPNYPMVFMQVVRHGSGLRSMFDFQGNNGVFIEFRVKYWLGTDVSNLVAFFGEMK
ncbi:uncharacterized protein LOC136091314 [Hydra vulgaris]|uniref:Uncharacterized protein LOC136091314 n=1 Tax=Hydra vulgaris TaxID=6087 RepID=A0ABM4DJV7_HYDVU